MKKAKKTNTDCVPEASLLQYSSAGLALLDKDGEPVCSLDWDLFGRICERGLEMGAVSPEIVRTHAQAKDIDQRFLEQIALAATKDVDDMFIAMLKESPGQ